MATLLAVTPALAYEALSVRSFYMSEAEGGLLLHDLPEDLDEADLRADITIGLRELVHDLAITRGRLPWIAFPTAGLPLGDSELTVNLRADGRDLGSVTTVVTRRPVRANAVQVDRLGGGLVVDGLPFFPFGFYCDSPVQATLAEEVVARGFNLMSPYQSNDPVTVDERRQTMDRAAELGMKVHFQLLRVAGGGSSPAPDTSAARRRAWLRAEVESFRHHPALLAWYISEEPAGHGVTPEELEAAAAIVRQLDPYHPVTIFVNPGASARYAGAMDLAMTDPYPDPRHPLRRRGRRRTHRARRRGAAGPAVARAAGFRGQPVVVPGADGDGAAAHDLLGIVEGATGMQYFIRHGLGGFPRSPDTWAAASRAALEVAALTPYLLSPEARPEVDTGDETLRAAAWRDGADVVVAIVNTQNHPREMKVALPGLSWDRSDAEVLYEDRVVATKSLRRSGPFGLLLKPVRAITGLLRAGSSSGVRFGDIIDAYGVRLYRFAGPSEPTKNELNTLIDPSFEWDAAPSVPAAVYADVGAGRGATYFVDSRVAAHGRRSLRLHTPRDGEGVRIRPYAPAFVPERTYRFSVRARARTAGVTLRLHNAAGGDSLDIELTTAWRRYALDSTVHAVSTRAWLWLGLVSAGTAWIDDVELFDISPQIVTVPQPGSHTISLESVIDDTELRWRLDGAVVTAADPLYTVPVTIAGASRLRVGLFRGDHLISRAGLDLHDHDALGRFVDLEHLYSPRYAAAGPGALTDGILGTEQIADGHWQGFEGQDLVAVIDLGQPTDVSTVRVRFLQSVESGIWMPRVMEVNLSDDGRLFRPFATADHAVDERRMDLVIQELTARAAPDRARYVRVRARSMGQCPAWHPGAGGAAWVFADEIRVNGE